MVVQQSVSMEPVDADVAVARIEDKKIRQTSKSVYLGAQVGFVQYLVRQMVGVTWDASYSWGAGRNEDAITCAGDAQTRTPEKEPRLSAV